METNLLAELHSLPDEALLTADEAAQFLCLKYTTLAWYRCQGVGPKFSRVGPKLRRACAAATWARASA
ncbi:helix-turn-helix transcriptional regulator [Xanthomonas theicola]|uniref:Uncharacterized protein n=1 Tax=Xanthomonas theicola TaxID=56464 RepID=A0A2S6ZBR7_9XANT|nr:hypothetical protein [Xanthomonas theicola]PPT83895.1 hypothetical protein XthCFBP4691_16590 [Xanthomonas theicola]QNH26195.1 hypothetical protein G4Q83_17635 [Xanthomonas theicola]